MARWLAGDFPPKSFPFPSVFSEVFFPRVRRVIFADRCRRFDSCRTMSSHTSSYPDSWVQAQRPRCRTCMTAATGGSAPSNRRAGLRPTSCSCGQEPPGRKFSHALIQGKCHVTVRVARSAFRIASRGDPAEVGHGATARAPAPQVNGQRCRHNARASSLSVLRLPLRAMGVMRKDCAPAATSCRWSTKPHPQDSCTQKT